MPPQQRTILIVDDDREILESMRTVLENKGYRILVARDGNAGLMIAERENPDLLVLDMMMPKKSGFLVLEKLKSRPGGLIPTIMITGNEGSRHRAYAEMLGVRDYIRKPFAMEKLVRAVERVMGVRDARRGFRRRRALAGGLAGVPCRTEHPRAISPRCAPSRVSPALDTNVPPHGLGATASSMVRTRGGAWSSTLRASTSAATFRDASSI